MAENQTGQDKTERATAKRREDAREKGNVARSTEVNTVVVLLVSIIALKMLGDVIVDQVSQFMTKIYHDLSTTALTVTSVSKYSIDGLETILLIIGPVLGLIMLGGILSNVLQIGFSISLKAIEPKFEKISPAKGFKRLFSSRSLVELAKGLAKIAIVGYIGYSVVMKYLDDYWLLMGASTPEVMVFMGSLMFELALKVVIFLIFIAAADYAFTKYEYENNLKMTKQEVKDEQKQHEGDPLIKRRIRQKQMEVSRNRMMSAVPDATVVVTNPTHIAIALQYEPGNKTGAPKVLAMGQRKVAERIKQIARDSGVPIIEDKPLARALFEVMEVGLEIPAIFYQAVAEVLSKVFQMSHTAQGKALRSAYAR